MKDIKKGVLGAALIFAVIFSGCSKKQSGKQYLAKNVIFANGAASIRGLNMAQNLLGLPAQASDVDTTTQVLANNVLFANATGTSLTSSNVQDALTEIAPKLTALMVGTWSIKNYVDPASQFTADGAVSFDANGNFTMSSGAFAAIQVKSSGGCGASGGTFTALLPKTLQFSYTTSGGSFSPIPILLEMSASHIAWIGFGGCGTTGGMVTGENGLKVSILTKQS